MSATDSKMFQNIYSGMWKRQAQMEFKFSAMSWAKHMMSIYLLLNP